MPSEQISNKKIEKLNLHGWINLDKPRGISSNGALSKVKRLLNVKKAGHTGTLDPEAQGVLPIAIGEATKTITFINDEIKAYEFTVKFGMATDTGDLEGKIVAESKVIPTENEIENILKDFLGKIKQTPPIYSAIKINGERAYALARKGIAVDIPTREVLIHELKLLDFLKESNEARFYVLCSKGTYVRSLAVDLSTRLGSVACATSIKRVKSGVFSINDAITLENLENLVHNALLTNYLKAVEFVLDDIPVVAIDTPQTQQKLRNGQNIQVPNNSNSPIIAKAMFQNKLVAVGEVNAGFFVPKRIFNL